MSTVEVIVKDLERLSPDKLAKAANYIHGLQEVNLEERLAALKVTGGCLSEEEADAFEKAIEEGCEQIDLNDWK